MPVAQINNKLILFIHIPKTGGSSIEKHLKKHSPLSLYGQMGPPTIPCSSRHFHGALLQDLFADTVFDWSFMVVRHPLRRLLSQYRYRARDEPLTRSTVADEVCGSRASEVGSIGWIGGERSDAPVRSIAKHPAHDRLIAELSTYQTRKPNPVRNNLPFSVWLRYVLARRRINPYYRDNHFRPQHEFGGCFFRC